MSRVWPKKPSKGSWSVMRINDDGRRQSVSVGLSHEAASSEAGKRRDRMTDAEIGEGWNYLPRRQRTGGQ